MDKFKFVKTIDVKKDSIFYSVIHYKNEILGFCRERYDTNQIKFVKFNTQFDIIDDDITTIPGEDPRCFIHNGKLYILNNFFSRMTLFDYDTRTIIKLPFPGKNISFISHDNELFVIHYIKPFIMYKIDFQLGSVKPVQVLENGHDEHLLYRGGTPGYKISDKSYYGYGHKTYITDGELIHDIFRWDVDFSNHKPEIKIKELVQPPNSKSICDPTSVIEVDDKRFLLTAESDKSWFCDQDYMTNVYQIE